MKKISRRGFLAGVAALAAGCSGGNSDGGGGTPPTIENVIFNNGNNDYEGNNVTISADITGETLEDPQPVRLQYRLSGSADPWTDVIMSGPAGGTYTATFPMPASDKYDIRIHSYSTSASADSPEQTVDSWANEANAETEIIAKLAEFKANGDIDDYWGPNYTFPLADTTTITVDASVIDLSSAPSIKAISYKGESDTDLTAYLNEISRLNADPIPVTDIREMIRSRLPTEMDDAELNDWPNNVYVERIKESSEMEVALAGTGLVGAAVAFLSTLDSEKEYSMRDLCRKAGGFARKYLPAVAGILGVALAAKTASAEEKPARDNIEERVENGKKIKTVYNKNGVARIEETTEDKSKYKTNIYKLDWHTAEPRLVGIEEGIIQNNQNVRLTTKYFNIEKYGKKYTIIADHEKKIVELKKMS